LPDVDESFLEIYICPCEAAEFACPHTGEDRGDDEGAPAAGRILDHRLEFGPRGEIDAFAQWADLGPVVRLYLDPAGDVLRDKTAGLGEGNGRLEVCHDLAAHRQRSAAVAQLGIELIYPGHGEPRETLTADEWLDVKSKMLPALTDSAIFQPFSLAMRDPALKGFADANADARRRVRALLDLVGAVTDQASASFLLAKLLSRRVPLVST
jgi:hypothetical protein